jgi:hypothetical protein
MKLLWGALIGFILFCTPIWASDAPTAPNTDEKLETQVERVDTLRIDSPVDGTVVEHGQTISVSVQTAPGLGVKQLGIIGTDNIASIPKNEGPFTFDIQIPKVTQGEEIQLFVMATNTNGDKKITSAKPLILKIKPEIPLLTNLTYTQQLDTLFAGYPDGSIMIFSEENGKTINVSSNPALSITSDHPEIAKVLPSGERVLITPVAVGKAEITIVNRDKTFAVPVEVKALPKGDFNADAKVTAEDLIEIYKYKDKPTKDFPAMDLDANGTIDSKDSTLLKGMIQ